MNHDIKDGLIVLCLALILTVSGFLTYLVSSFLYDSCGRLGVVAVVVSFCLMSGLLSLAYLRLLSRIAPLKRGKYPMDHPQTFLWKQHTVIRDVGERFLKPFFPLFLGGLYYRLLGVEMGTDATVAVRGIVADPLLTKMGAHAVIGENACVSAHCIVNERLVLEPVTIGRGATIGANAVVLPGANIGEGAVVAPGAVLSPGTEVPAYEMWGGVPAKKIKALRVAVELARTGAPECVWREVGEQHAGGT